MLKAKLKAKMIAFYGNNTADINHFLKVSAFAEIIGKLERIDDTEQDVLEIAAIVHDIACPLCREKYGNANGKHQEQESEALLRPFLSEFELPEIIEERVIYLVAHHHTYTNVQGKAHQILLEADYLVNAEESAYSMVNLQQARNQIFRTSVGIDLLNSIFLLKKLSLRNMRDDNQKLGY